LIPYLIGAPWPLLAAGPASGHGPNPDRDNKPLAFSETGQPQNGRVPNGAITG